MIVLLIMLCTLLSVVLAFSIVLNVRLVRFANRFEANYEQAQEVLDKAYADLFDVLERPVHVDDPVTRRVVAQLRNCQESVLKAAMLISMQDDELTNESPKDGRDR